MSERRKRGSTKICGGRVIASAALFLALFVVLGGTAAALPGRGTVRSDDIARKAVHRKHLAKNALKGLLRGDGRQFIRSFTADATGFQGRPPVLARVPSMGVVELLACFGEPNPDIRIRLRSFARSRPFLGVGQVTWSDAPQGTGPAPETDQGGGIFSAGTGSPFVASGQGGDAFPLVATWDFHLSRGTGTNTRGAHVSVSGLNNGRCHVTATGEIQN